MDSLKTDEEAIFTSDVSDRALEIAGTVSDDNMNFTWGVCTIDQVGCPA